MRRCTLRAWTAYRCSSVVHKGGTASNGPPVVTLQLASDDEVCVDVEADLLRDIARNSRNYYVNVHTEAFPQGAVRGQLGS